MNEISCGVARDLLGPAVEELLGEESRAMLDAHLAGCANCSAELERLREIAAAGPYRYSKETGYAPAVSASDSLRRMKQKLRRRRIFTVLLSVLLFAGLLLSFAAYGLLYYPPMPYEKDMLGVGPYKFDHEVNDYVLDPSNDEWWIMNKYGQYADQTQMVTHTNADGSLQIWAFVYSKKMPLFYRWVYNLSDNDNPTASGWTGSLLLYPPPDLPSPPPENVHATVYWTKGGLYGLQGLQIVERETDHLTQEVLDISTLIWDGDIIG